MIDPAYCVMMARYNGWQNRQLRKLCEGLSLEDLTRDRGAFFGSIFGTLNHVLWADQMWLARLTKTELPPTPEDNGVTWQPTFAAWSAERFRVDGRLLLWAEKLSSIDLRGPLTWYSGIKKADVSRPIAQCVVHLFNHQTHHRGQVHAMLTAAGLEAPVSDVAFMPDKGPWV